MVLKAWAIGIGKHTIFDRHHRYRTVVVFFWVNNSVTMTPNQQLLYYTIINSLENVCFLSKQIEISCLWCQQTVLDELKIKQTKFEVLIFNRISSEQKLLLCKKDIFVWIDFFQMHVYINTIFVNAEDGMNGFSCNIYH